LSPRRPAKMKSRSGRLRSSQVPHPNGSNCEELTARATGPRHPFSSDESAELANPRTRRREVGRSRASSPDGARRRSTSLRRNPGDEDGQRYDQPPGSRTVPRGTIPKGRSRCATIRLIDRANKLVNPRTRRRGGLTIAERSGLTERSEGRCPSGEIRGMKIQPDQIRETMGG
jgi:hypothetical protein